MKQKRTEDAYLDLQILFDLVLFIINEQIKTQKFGLLMFVCERYIVYNTNAAAKASAQY